MQRPPSSIDLGDVTLDFEAPLLMGVINVTPDSFSDGGRHRGVDAATTRAEALVEQGAAIIDIGGESTRPGSDGVDTATELDRVLPVLKALQRRALGAVISIDTSKASVARAALDHGARIVNDVTALSDAAMAPLVAEHGAALILMHMRGAPRVMQSGGIVYTDLMGEIRQFLGERIERAVSAGVAAERVLIDPGIGFGKTVEHNLSITAQLGCLRDLGAPIVYGPSRKHFLGEITGHRVDDRERATAGACAAAVLAGADVLRVHDVAAIRDAVAVASAIRAAS